MSTNPKTPAQTMAVQQRETRVAAADEKEMRFIPFASDTEIKLTVAIVTNLICIPTRDGHRCSPQDAIKFMMMCQARKLNPFEGDAFMQGYDSRKGPIFNLITAHQAFLKRAEVNKEYDGMESGVMVMSDGIEELQGDFVPEGKTLVGGWAKVHLKHRKIPMYRRLDLRVFRKVNSEGKPYGRWEDDPAGMIVKCAEADALRSAFPTMLGNLYLEQELNPGDKEKNVTPAPQILAPPFITQPSPPPADSVTQKLHNLLDPTKLPVAKAEPDPEPIAEDEPEPSKAHPAGDTEEKPDVTAQLDLDGVIKLIQQLATRDGVSEDQIIGHMRNTKMMTAKQTELGQMSDSKLRTLANRWNEELNAIRAITV